MDIVERLRDWADNNYFSPEKTELTEAIDEIERLRNAIKAQANAVRVLHEAETSELNHLRGNAQEAYTAKTTLDSEREANKILTDEIERLREDKRLAFKLMSEFLEEINRLRRGLHRIASIETDPDFGTLPISEAQKIAQDTLEEE